jgi:hypothetical protein
MTSSVPTGVCSEVCEEVWLLAMEKAEQPAAIRSDRPARPFLVRVWHSVPLLEKLGERIRRGSDRRRDAGAARGCQPEFLQRGSKRHPAGPELTDKRVCLRFPVPDERQRRQRRHFRLDARHQRVQ